MVETQVASKMSEKDKGQSNPKEKFRRKFFRCSEVAQEGVIAKFE